MRAQKIQEIPAAPPFTDDGAKNKSNGKKIQYEKQVEPLFLFGRKWRVWIVIVYNGKTHIKKVKHCAKNKNACEGQ